MTVCDSVRVGTEGLFPLCLKTFVAPFPPARLTAPRSPRMVRITLSHLLINSFSRFPETFAPLQDSHLFKIDTVQYCVGLRSSQPSTSISCNFISSSAFAPSFELAASPTMHLDNHFDPVYRATSKWPIGHFRVAPSLCLKARLRAKPMI